MSTIETALTAHLVVSEVQNDELLHQLREELHERFDIDYSTFQIGSDSGNNIYCSPE